MRVHIRLERPYLADGTYEVDADGFEFASLFWANESGPLEGWTALARLLLDASGRARFAYAGGRSVPAGATHIAVRLTDAGGERQAVVLEPLPNGCTLPPFEPDTVFAVMSDLHTAAKPGRVRRALRLAAQADCVLIAGDLTNDAAPRQFSCLAKLIEEELPNTPVLPVCGNHDYPVLPLPVIFSGEYNYPAFQKHLLERAARLGATVQADESGAYRALFRGEEILGLNAASHFRRFVFLGGRQLTWLDGQMAKEARRRIILCHAPLKRHRPKNVVGKPPFLSRDDALEKILDARGKAVFLSGHTHLSLNEPGGCVELDLAANNLYLNDSCVTPTMPICAEAIADAEWVDGAVCFLSVNGTGIEISARCLSSGKMIARGYYRMDYETSTYRE